MSIKTHTSEVIIFRAAVLNSTNSEQMRHLFGIWHRENPIILKHFILVFGFSCCQFANRLKETKHLRNSEMLLILTVFLALYLAFSLIICCHVSWQDVDVRAGELYEITRQTESKSLRQRHRTENRQWSKFTTNRNISGYCKKVTLKSENRDQQNCNSEQV